MLPLQERDQKKGIFNKRSSEYEKRYLELYAEYCQYGYTKNLADAYADFFVNDAKKPVPEDIIQTAQLYDAIHEVKTAAYYLSKLEESKKLSSDEKFTYCVESLKAKSKIGNWRDAEDFRTENINFMQNYSVKADMNRKADMYIALALVDCAAKQYAPAFRLLMGFGYKPVGRNDKTLMDILITGVYICAKSGDKDSLDNAVNNAFAALDLFNEFDHQWTKSYYERCIDEASRGII